MRIRNVHTRRIAASADHVGSLLDTLGSDRDQFWQTELAEPVVFAEGLRITSQGGHGTLRYRVSHSEPGRSIEAEFEPGVGLRGRHRFDVTTDDQTHCTLQHTLEATLQGQGRLAWPLGLRAIHDAVVEDVFNHVERTVTGAAHPTSTKPVHAFPRSTNADSIRDTMRRDAVVSAALDHRSHRRNGLLDDPAAARRLRLAG
jgi:hypothetical protein